MGLLAELGRLSVAAWSPGGSGGGYIATGTYAGSVDTSFTDSVALELLSVDIQRSKLVPVATLPAPAKFGSLDWSNPSRAHPAGLIAGGLVDGTVRVWDAASLIRTPRSQPDEKYALVYSSSSSSSSSSNHTLTSNSNSTATNNTTSSTSTLQGADANNQSDSSTTSHAGPVRAVQFNPVLHHLVASGAADGSVLVWDLSNPNSAVTARHPACKPGAPPSAMARTAASSKDEITTVAWNRKVHNILSTASSAGVMNVWDLKQSRQVISIRNPRGRLRCSSLAWHPEIATQIIITCDEDDSTAAMLWDLRNATAPVSSYTHHSPKGIVSASWSTHDPDLLLTASKDCRTAVVSVSTGEVIVDSPPRGSDWNFDIKWSPRIPGLYVASSFDGRLSVNSILAASSAPSVSSETATALAESFGANAGDFRSGMADQSPRTTDSQRVIYSSARPPKWLKRPSTVSFSSLGGWMTHVSSSTGSGQNAKPTTAVSIDALTKDEVPLVNAINDDLDKMLMDLTANDPSPAQKWCEEKSKAATVASKDKLGWDVLTILFGTDARRKLIEYLGFKLPPKDVVDDIDMPVYGLLQSQPIAMPVRSIPSDAPNTGMPSTDLNGTADITTEGNGITNGIGNLKMDGPAPWDVSDSFGAEGNGTKGGSLLDGDEADKPENGTKHVAPSESKQNETKDKAKSSFIGKPASEIELMIKRAVIVGDFRTAVDGCLHMNKMADALVIAHAGGPDLWLHAQSEYLTKSSVSVSSGSKVIGAIAGPKSKMDEYITEVAASSSDSWKEALAAILTYSPAEELYGACTALGNRLPKASNGALACFLCAYNVSSAAGVWVDPPISARKPTVHLMAERVKHLTVIVERSRLLTAATALAQGDHEIGAVRAPDPTTAISLCEFGALLSFNGLYTAAVTYLGNLDPDCTSVYGSAGDLAQKASDGLALSDDSSMVSNTARSTMNGGMMTSTADTNALSSSLYSSNPSALVSPSPYVPSYAAPQAGSQSPYAPTQQQHGFQPPSIPTPYGGISQPGPLGSNNMPPLPPPPPATNMYSAGTSTALPTPPPIPQPQTVANGMPAPPSAVPTPSLPPMPMPGGAVRPGGVGIGASVVGNATTTNSSSTTTATVLPPKVASRPSQDPSSVYAQVPAIPDMNMGSTGLSNTLPPPPPQVMPGAPGGATHLPPPPSGITSFTPTIPVPTPVYPGAPTNSTTSVNPTTASTTNSIPNMPYPPSNPMSAATAPPPPTSLNAMGQAMPLPPSLPPPPTDGEGPPPSSFYAKARQGAGAKLPPSAEVAVAEQRRERAPSSSGTPGGPPRRSTSVSSSISALVTETVYLDKMDTTKLTGNSASIVKSLRACLTQARAANPSSGMYRRKMEDINKRLGKLAAGLSSGVVEADVVEKLVKICKAVDSQQLQEARQMLAVMSKEYWDTSRAWLQGLGWLLDSCR